jgi:hypothetical protein
LVAMKILLVLAPTLGMAANVLGHLAITWFSCRWGVYGRMGFGAIFGAAVTMTIAVVASLQLGLGVREAFAYVAFDLATMLTLAFGYFNLVQMNISSLRLRIANELIGEPDGVPAERLFARYSGREIVDARLERLSRGKQIVLRNGRYYHCISVVYLVAVAMDTMKRVVFRRRIRDGFAKLQFRDNA